MAIERALFFPEPDTTSVLQPYDEIGAGICISFDAKGGVSCDIKRGETSTPYGARAPYLLLSGTCKKRTAWLGVEVSLNGAPRDITLRLRGYPMGTISPFIYGENGGQIRLPDHPMTDSFFSLKIAAADWNGTLPAGESAAKIGFMMDAHHWFALGISNIWEGAPDA